MSILTMIIDEVMDFPFTSGLGEWISPALVGGNPPSMGAGRRNTGISMAQQKRASRKAKNVKRHRAACRR